VLFWSIWILCLALVALTRLLAYLTPTLPERFEGYCVYSGALGPRSTAGGHSTIRLTSEAATSPAGDLSRTSALLFCPANC
jgi:hypothetical protein